MRYLLFLTLAVLMIGCGKKETRVEISEEERPAEFLKFGNQFYQDKDYENAFRAYGFIYYNHPTSREYIDAAIGLSRCYGALENYDKAFSILHELLQNNLIPTKVPDIYNAIAEFYERSAGISEELSGAGEKDFHTAIDYYKKSIEYPNSENMTAKGFAQYQIGSLYESMADFTKALKAYETTRDNYTGTEWATRAEESIIALNQRIQRRNEYQQSGLLPDSTGATPQ